MGQLITYQENGEWDFQLRAFIRNAYTQSRQTDSERVRREVTERKLCKYCDVAFLPSEFAQVNRRVGLCILCVQTGRGVRHTWRV